MPSPGQLTVWTAPSGPDVRVDSHCYAGYFIPSFYDSLIAKLIVRGADRAEAIDRMALALADFVVEGIHTTIPFHQAVFAHPDFVHNRVTTRWVEETFMKQSLQKELSA